MPSGVKKVKIAVAGGGGGKISSCYIRLSWEYAGTSSVAGLIQATGGSNSVCLESAHDMDDNYDLTYYVGKGGTPNGKSGVFTSRNAGVNGTGWALNFDMQVGDYGKGGGGAAGNRGNATGGGGYNRGTFTVTPGQTLTCVVGAKLNTLGGGNQASGDGFVLVAWGGDII